MPSTTVDSGAVFRMAITEPAAIDPYRAQEIEGIGVTKLLFVGLVQVERDHRLAPAVAQSWECDGSGRTWTFRLRHDVRFSNGERVDAASFVRGLNRALDPVADTETAYHVAAVRGYRQMRSGQATTLAGVRAVDRWTLVFELDEVDFEFDKKTLQPIFSPVPAVAGTALNQAFNDQPVGNGPYLMAEPWQHGRSITLRRNPGWFGPPPAVQEVRIDIVDPDTALDTEYRGFQEGRYDFARIPAEKVGDARARYLSGGGFISRDLPGLHYLIPFCHHGPMATVAARRAVSAAIDRTGIARRLFARTRLPASSLISPWFTDQHTADLGAPYTSYDRELARACAAEAGLLPGSTLDLAYNTGAGHDSWVEAVAAGLRRVLGLEVRLLRMSTPELVVHRTSAAAQGLCRAGWAYDYPTPDNLLYPLLHSACTSPDADGTAHGDNEGRYASPAFDEAVLHARATADGAERIARWRAAERIAMADMALIPLWYRTEYRVYAADAFTGMDLDFFGNPTIAQLQPVPPDRHTPTRPRPAPVPPASAAGVVPTRSLLAKRMIEPYDVVGVGFGPANLALAIALEEDAPDLAGHFVEAQREPLWQGGMLLPGSNIQNHPNRDLVSLRNPRSRYSFLNYLFENNRLLEHLNLPVEFPLRKEYAQYVGWVTGQLAHHADFGARVQDLSVVEHRGEQVYAVTAADGRRWLGRAVVLAPGRTPYIPAPFDTARSPRIFHLVDYLYRLRDLAEPPRSVAVIGGSQSAVELTLDLARRFPRARVVNYLRSYGLRLKDTSPFSEEGYFPGFTEYYYKADRRSKSTLDNYMRLTNYSSADADVLHELYVLMYEQRLDRDQRVHVQGNSLVTAVQPGPDSVGLHVAEVHTGQVHADEVDLVVLATGFRDLGPAPHQEPYPALLAGLADRLAFDPDGYLRVNVDYRVDSTDPAVPPLFLNGLCESSHGIGDAGSFSLLSLRAGVILDGLRKAGPAAQVAQVAEAAATSTTSVRHIGS